MATRAELQRIEEEDEQLYQLYLKGGLSADDFGRRHKPLTDRRSELEDELPRIQAQLDVIRVSATATQAALSDASDLAHHWTRYSPEEKRNLVETITDKIIIGKEEVSVALLRSPFSTSPHPSERTSGKATDFQGFIAATNWNRAG